VFWEAPPIGTPTVFAGAFTAGSTTSYSVTTTAAITANNLAVVVITSQVPSSTLSISAISDGTNTYTLARRVGTTSAWFEIWYKLNATAVASSATITATCAATCAFSTKAYIAAVQVSNITALDVTTGASTCGTGTVLTTAALAQVNDLAIAFVGSAGGSTSTYSPPTQYSNLVYSGTSIAAAGAVDTLSNINLINKNGQIYTAAMGSFSGTTGCILAMFKGN
jgi:hypothetical protein